MKFAARKGPVKVDFCASRH